MTLEEGVEFLRSRGLIARIREWAMGRTILITADPQDFGIGGIQAWGRALYIIPSSDGTWVVEETPSQLSFSSLELACQHVAQTLKKDA